MNTRSALTSSLIALSLALVACGPATPAAPAAPQGRTLYGLSSEGQLVRFGSDNAASSLTRTAVTGLAAGERLVGLDYGPVDGKLYAISSSSRLYTLTPSSGQVTAIGTAAFAPGLNGAAFGMDFNPVPNRIRVHSSSGQNLRLNQENGSAVDGNTTTDGVQPDGTLTYVAGDAGAGQTPSLVGTAYTNSLAGASNTVLYAIDSARDTLVRVSDPNKGEVQTVGALGVNTTDSVGFDISADGLTFLTLTPQGASASSLYGVNVQTGAASKVADLNGVTLVGLAVAP